MWLLLALGLATGLVLLIVRSRRRSAWSKDLATATDEVQWFARDLLLQLQSVSSPEQVAGGWAVGAPRIVAVEDRLTALEATAPSESDRAQTVALRDAVRQAREEMERGVAPGSPPPLPQELAAIAARLESALSPSS